MMMTGKLSVIVEAFTPRHSNTLRGFASILIPEMRLRIHDVSVHQHENGTRWVGLPSKPQVGRDGVVRKDERGKALYTPILQFADRATADAFGQRVITGLLEFAPSAFETEEVA